MAEEQKSLVVSEKLSKTSNRTKENLRREKSPKPTQTKNKISVCDVMKNNTSKVIKKMESQVPLFVQQYSDLYSEYLHTFDDLFGTCYIAEKQFFDRLGIDQDALKVFDNYSNTLANFYSSQIDLSSNFLRSYVQMRISAIKSYDSYMHIMMDSYASMLSQFNSVFDKAVGKTTISKNYDE